MLKTLTKKNSVILFVLNNNIKAEEKHHRVYQLLIKFFYFFIFYLSLQSFNQHSILPFWDDLLQAKHYFSPLWCTQWMSYFKWDYIIHFSLIFFLLMSFIAMLLGTQYKIIRIILFLSFFNYTALINSFGKIDHYLHLSLLISFILIFYTHQPNRIAKLFKSIQLFILSTYTISGIFKFWGIITQSIQGEITVFNPNSLAYNLSKTIYNTGNKVYFQDLILNQPSYLFSFFLFLGYLLELVAILAIIKTKLLPWMGIFLVLLHTIILLTVGPNFIFQIVILILFLILPYSLTSTNWKNKA